MENLDFKICRECNRTLPLTNKYFRTDKRCRDGFQPRCNKCFPLINKNYQKYRTTILESNRGKPKKSPKERLKKTNEYSVVYINGESYISFTTGGKYVFEVIVDKHVWENYLNKYYWTGATNGGGYFFVKNNECVKIHRMIIENEFKELDYWGNIVDHINNDPMDNRLENLRICNPVLNPTNKKSKYETEGTSLIYAQTSTLKSGNKVTYGYQVRTNIFDEKIYKNFETLEEAIEYRDNYVLPLKENKINELKKKVRDIEFERGLRDKIQNSEIDEIISVFSKYNLIINENNLIYT